MLGVIGVAGAYGMPERLSTQSLSTALKTTLTPQTRDRAGVVAEAGEGSGFAAGDAVLVVPELERRLEDINARLDVPITVNINGCPNSCARIQVADIGFKGQMVDDGHGGSVEGFQVHLGGSLGLDSGFGRKLRQHKVTSEELGDYIERVVRNFLKHRNGGERFAQWVVRAEAGDLR